MRLARPVLFICIFVPMLALQTSLSDITFNEKVFAKVSSRYGQAAEGRARAWQSLIEDSKEKSIEDQLFDVNRFFNRLAFVDDYSHWQQKDYWATPLEFLGTAAGDCEDFAIAKYFSLVSMGVPKEKLRLMYVTATRPTRQAHMVLAYYEEANSIPLVLDNINKRILPASKRRDLLPIYSFNGDGLWLAKSQGQGRKMQGKNNNNMWSALNERMKNGN